jgi:drug/metabolite transporter (DMT)-like permease
MWDEFVWPSLYLTLVLVLVGVFTQVGQYGLTKAMQTQAAGKASAYSYIQIVFSALLGVWLFNEIPSFWTYLGGGLIVTGALINVFGSKMLKPFKRAA